ncbi:hypothetical protein Hamer_G012374 [Homarus americanus]|uniref:Uncharacterized protein n=1 Tax=Homarus americanus TaxID=6706 RepID=A0A8J5KBS7_HOMAM|nr:hypothetical protein Hamer_G012374 [Homarus americanus]
MGRRPAQRRYRSNSGGHLRNHRPMTVIHGNNHRTPLLYKQPYTQSHSHIPSSSHEPPPGSVFLTLLVLYLQCIPEAR